MIDVSLKGVRCRAANEILDIDGTIGAATEGTIVYELEGEGGQLVNVHWDDGTRSLVSSDGAFVWSGDSDVRFAHLAVTGVGHKRRWGG